MREIEERQQDRRGRDERLPHREDVASVQAAQDRDEDDQDHDRQVLDQCDPDHHSPVARVELAAVEEQPGQDHRAGHGHDHPDDRPLDRAPPESGAGDEPERDGQDDAEGPAEDRDPPDAHEILQRELDAEREHQEHDTDLGEELEGVDVRDRRPRRERTHQEPAGDVAEDQRLAREPGERPAQHRGHEHVGEVSEEDRVGDHRRPCPGQNYARRST